MNKKITDLIEISAKTLLSSIPIGGTLITTVWDTVKNNQIERRQEEWKNMIEYRLSTLEISINNLGSNENFATCLLKSTELAIKTHSQEKKVYLTNALINSINLNFNETTILMFLNLIEEYTDLHMIILNFFYNPLSFNSVKNSNLYTSSPLNLFYEEYPEFKSQNSLILLISKKLYNDGLLDSESLNISMTINGAKSKRTSNLGDNFLSFFQKKTTN